METIKQNIGNLFFLDDEISCPGMDTTYRISAILEDHVQLLPLPSGSDEITLDYGALSTALSAIDEAEKAPASTALQCLASHYLMRQQQAERDDAVDAMWRTAIVCQL